MVAYFPAAANFQKNSHRPAAMIRGGGGGGGGEVVLQSPVDAARFPVFTVDRRSHKGAAFMKLPSPPSSPSTPTCSPREHEPLLPTAAVQQYVLQQLLQQQKLSPTTLVAAIRAADQLSPAAIGAAADQQKEEVTVRDVWSYNLVDELRNIAGVLRRYTGVCVDTEFPGTVVDSGTPHHLRSPEQTYAVVKSNVDKLKLLQLGLTFFDPNSGDRCPVVWQFNFRGFDEERDLHAPVSVAMLKDHGVDFPELRDHGIDARVFADEFAQSALVRRRNDPEAPELTWAAFSGSYDFAYLVKLLGGGDPLPETLPEFLDELHAMFGPWVLDVKYIARFCGGGIHGGLERMAAVLGVERAAGSAHHAGSDSLLAADVLLAMVDRFLGRGGEYAHAGKIYSLAVLLDLGLDTYNNQK